MATDEQIARWEHELAKIATWLSWRWGETRRFQSNHRKLERRQWLINKLSIAYAERKAMNKVNPGGSLLAEQ